KKENAFFVIVIIENKLLFCLLRPRGRIAQHASFLEQRDQQLLNEMDWQRQPGGCSCLLHDLSAQFQSRQ
ncbi:GSCOCG00003301001-RA-CDS, partial [Cotesia congregata]